MKKNFFINTFCLLIIILFFCGANYNVKATSTSKEFLTYNKEIVSNSNLLRVSSTNGFSLSNGILYKNSYR